MALNTTNLQKKKKMWCKLNKTNLFNYNDREITDKQYH